MLIHLDGRNGHGWTQTMNALILISLYLCIRDCKIMYLFDFLIGHGLLMHTQNEYPNILRRRLTKSWTSTIKDIT